MEEKTFFEQGGIKVTNARFISGGQTYSMNNVTSIKTSVIAPKRLWLVVGLVFGGMMALSGLMASNPVMVLLGGGLAGWCAYSLWRQRPQYDLLLTTAAGEASALSTGDKALLDRIVAALNDAIVARG